MHSLKKITTLITIGLILLISDTDFAVSPAKRIAIIQKTGIKPFETALISFKQIIKESDLSYVITVYDIADKESDYNIVEVIKQTEPDVILTLGSEATRMMNTDIKHIPIVFSMVLNPVKEGFVKSMENTGNNLTGVSLRIPVIKQFDKIKSVLSFVKKIGIMYDPGKSDLIIKEAENAAQIMKLELLLKPIHSAREIPITLERLKGKVDVIWAIPDSTVYTGASINHILLFSLRNKIPIIGFSASFVKAGAIMGVYNDYIDIGRQTAKITMKLLAGKSPAEISVVKAGKMKMALNLIAAKLLGIKIENRIIKGATEVFK